MSQHKLVLAEKPYVGKSIAAVLGATTREDGFFSGNGYYVTWCIGHLVEMAKADAYDARYAKWRREDLPIIPKEFKTTAPKDKVKQLKVIVGLMARPDVDTVICATDAGREGELIFRLVYEHCKCTKPIQRLWISSMEEKAIVEGFENLRPGTDYMSLYRAALCRARADWIIGINMTRLFSTLYNATLNVGRVMTPTLALLVQRETAISSFQKEPWYMVELDCPVDTVNRFTASGEKYGDKQTAEDIRAACEGKPVNVVSVEQKEKTKSPPRLYDLTSLQREANRLHGYTAQQTLDYLQSLYEKKLATYPRTDSRFLTEDMTATAGSIVNYLQLHMPFGQNGYTPDMKRVTDNTKVNDHHGIIPTMEIAGLDWDAQLTGERNILTMLCARLLCATGEPHKYEETTAVLECGGHHFTTKGTTIQHDGWLATERAFLDTVKEKPKQENTTGLPVMAEGQELTGALPTVKEGCTSPPKHYTEDTLLCAMETAGAEETPEDAERKGLGTPATRAATIEKLVKGGFVQRAKKNLLPTEKGNNLISVLPDTIKSPALTAEWEDALKQVEQDAISADAFMDGIVSLTEELVKQHTTPAAEHVHLFAAPQAEPAGVCPRCNKAVQERNKGFFCENRDCGFALWKNDRFFTGKGKKLDRQTVTALLNEGRAKVSGFVSKKNGKKYSATVMLQDTGKYVNYKMDFEKKK